jgi:hypothetical protein
MIVATHRPATHGPATDVRPAAPAGRRPAS